MSRFHEHCQPSKLRELVANIQGVGQKLHFRDNERDLLFAEMVLVPVGERRRNAYVKANLSLEDCGEDVYGAFEM